MRRAKSLVLAVALISSMSISVNALAATLMVIEGHVYDPVGRALSGVTVTDNRGKTVSTDSSGYYRIEESSLSTYVVTASRVGLHARSQTVDPVRSLSPVNFTLSYVLSGSLAPSVFNNDPPKTLSISARSYAPASGQCVSFTDSSSGATVALAWQSTSADGSSNWTGNYDVPSGRADGTYSYSLSSSNCSGVALTNVVWSSFRIDSIAPVIDALSITPLDFGNTVFSSQPLLAKITDPGGSGVKPSTITFTLGDVDSGTENPPVVASVYNPSTGWAKSPAVSLVNGHVYRVTVTASDYAQNTSSASQSPALEGGGFLATSISPASTTAAIPTVTCSVSDIDLSTQKRTATCPGVRLDFNGASVTLGGNHHPVPDVAFVEQSVSLDGAMLKTTVAGLPQTKKAYPGQSHTISVRYDVPAKFSSSTTIPLSAKSSDLGTLVAEVDPTWTEVTLEMDPTTTAPSTAACSDPGIYATGVSCVPDPFLHRYMVSLSDSADTAAVVAEHSSAYGADVRVSYETSPKTYAGFIPFRHIASIKADSRVTRVVRDDTAHRYIEGEFITTVALDLNGNANIIDETGYMKIYDRFGKLLSEETLDATVASTSSLGNYRCVNDTTADYFYAYDPRDLSRSNNAFSYQFVFYPYLQMYARELADVGWTLQYEWCGTGGMQARNGWHTVMAGLGETCTGRDTALPPEECAPESFRIGWDWPEGDAESSVTVSLSFQATSGPVTINGSLSHTPRDYWKGSLFPPNPHHPLWDPYTNNSVHAWWEDGCYQRAFCWIFEGSKDFQGSVVQGLWEWPMDTTPTTYYFQYGAHWQGACGGWPFGIGCPAP